MSNPWQPQPTDHHVYSTPAAPTPATFSADVQALQMRTGQREQGETIAALQDRMTRLESRANADAAQNRRTRLKAAGIVTREPAGSPLLYGDPAHPTVVFSDERPNWRNLL